MVNLVVRTIKFGSNPKFLPLTMFAKIDVYLLRIDVVEPF